MYSEHAPVATQDPAQLAADFEANLRDWHETQSGVLTFDGLKELQDLGGRAKELIVAASEYNGFATFMNGTEPVRAVQVYRSSKRPHEPRVSPVVLPPKTEVRLIENKNVRVASDTSGTEFCIGDWRAFISLATMAGAVSVGGSVQFVPRGPRATETTQQ